MGRIPAAANAATLLVELSGDAIKPERVADVALGVRLRAYGFERYKTKRRDDEQQAARSGSSSPSAMFRPRKKRLPHASAVAEGVLIARDLVNEPANVLTRKSLPIAPAA